VAVLRRHQAAAGQLTVIGEHHVAA
jgi:hypothetical protein